MKITFQAGRAYRANIIERGDKHDQSVVHLLSTLPGEAFLVENKDGLWSVTPGWVSVVSSTDPVIVGEAVAKPKDEKPKYEKPKEKPKKKKVIYATKKR